MTENPIRRTTALLAGALAGHRNLKSWRPSALSVSMAVLLLAAAPAQAATYPEYANATLSNDYALLRIQKNIWDMITHPGELGRNAKSWAWVQINQTVVQNYTSPFVNLLLDAVAANSENSLENVSEGLRILGQNSSQLYCGNLSAGDCRNLSGPGGQGRSRLAFERDKNASESGVARDIARLRADMFYTSVLWWVETQKAFMGTLLLNSQ